MSRNSAVPHYKTPIRESKHNISKLMEVSTIEHDKDTKFASVLLYQTITKSGYNMNSCTRAVPFIDKVYGSSIDFSDGTTEKFSWRISNSFVVLSKLVTRECGMHLITREDNLQRSNLNLLKCLIRSHNKLSLRTCGEFMRCFFLQLCASHQRKYRIHCVRHRYDCI